MEGLDHASLRRFRFKVHFKPLTPNGNMYFYNVLLKPMADEKNIMSEDEAMMVRQIRNLTPGDFAVVKNKHAFSERSTLTHRKLIESLMSEVKYKKTEKAPIGFGLCYA